MTISSPYIVKFPHPIPFYGYSATTGVHNLETGKTIAKRYPGSTVIENGTGRILFTATNTIPILN